MNKARELLKDHKIDLSLGREIRNHGGTFRLMAKASARKTGLPVVVALMGESHISTWPLFYARMELAQQFPWIGVEGATSVQHNDFNKKVLQIHRALMAKFDLAGSVIRALKSKSPQKILMLEKMAKESFIDHVQLNKLSQSLHLSKEQFLYALNKINGKNHEQEWAFYSKFKKRTPKAGWVETFFFHLKERWKRTISSQGKRDFYMYQNLSSYLFRKKAPNPILVIVGTNHLPALEEKLFYGGFRFVR